MFQIYYKVPWLYSWAIVSIFISSYCGSGDRQREAGVGGGGGGLTSARQSNDSMDKPLHVHHYRG